MTQELLPERRLEGLQIGRPRRSRIIESPYSRDERIRYLEELAAERRATWPSSPRRVSAWCEQRVRRFRRWMESR